MFMKEKVAQSCPTFCNSMCSPRNSPGQNTGVGSHSLLQGIFPTQGSNPSLLHCRWIIHQLSHQGSPRILEWVAYPYSSVSSQPRNQTRGLLHCRQILYQLNYQGSLGVYDRIPYSFVCLKYCKRQIKESCCLHAYVLCSSQDPVLGEQGRFIFPSESFQPSL